MDIKFNQDEIEHALVMYLNSIGHGCVHESVDFSFMPRRKGSGLEVTIDVDTPELRYTHSQEPVVFIDVAKTASPAASTDVNKSKAAEPVVTEPVAIEEHKQAPEEVIPALAPTVDPELAPEQKKPVADTPSNPGLFAKVKEEADKPTDQAPAPAASLFSKK